MTKTEEMYLETARLESHQQVLRMTALCTIMDTTASAEYKKEIHQIYISLGFYPVAIENKKDGLEFSTPHLIYERHTAESWKKKFKKAERQVFEAALR